MARHIPEFPFRPWPLFHHRATLVGEWVAVWRRPRQLWGAFVVCDGCNVDLSRYRRIWVVDFPSRDDWIRRGMDATDPWAAHGYCRACARRYVRHLPSYDPPAGKPFVLTSHDITGWPLVPVTGFTLVRVTGLTTGSPYAFGRPMRRGWRDRLVRPRRS